MEFAILGPLEVRDGENEIRVSGRRTRALLAFLLVARNEVVSSDRILDELWPTAPPTSGRSAVQARIAALRRRLGGNRIVTREPGYLLRVDDKELDAARFDRLVDAGRRSLRDGDPATAEAALREALGLWRGDALIDAATYGFAQPEIRRLTEIRAGAAEDRVQALLELGRYRDVVADVEGLVLRHPFRERLRGQLIQALYGAGRQADALAAYDDARRVLSGELGIEPGPELQRLQQAVLAQDPALPSRPTIATAGRASSGSPAEPGAPVEASEHRRMVSAIVVGVGVVKRPGDAELMRRRRAASVAGIRTVIERHGGQMLPVMGERLTAVFGAPVVREDDAIRAIRAGLELAADPGHGVAIASGEVLVLDGAAWDATGEPIAEADRLIQIAALGEVVVDARTERLVRGQVRLRRLEIAPGAFAVGSIAQAPAEPDAPLAGRQDELAQLGQVLTLAGRSRTVHLVTVLGPAGIGKSRLARELATTAGSAGNALVLVGHCLAYGEVITFRPIAEMLDALQDLGELEPALERLADKADIERRLGLFRGAEDTSASIQEAFWAFRRLIEVLGGSRTVVLVVEDIHWAEPSLYALLEYLAGWTHEAAVVIVCLARSELLERAPTWASGKVNALTIVLGPLGDDATRRLLDGLPAARELDPAIRAQIEDAAEGNPLFLEQLVAHLDDVATDVAASIPPTIQALLAARIDRLDPGSRDVLERAAVVGRTFSAESVSALLPPDARRDASERLEGLEAAEFVRSDSSRSDVRAQYRFRHVLLQQAAYVSMTKQMRGDLHARVADWLESGAETRAAETDELIGFHLEQAARHRHEIGADDAETLMLASRASGRLRAAGRRTFAAGDMAAGAGLLTRAAELAPTDDHDRLASLPDLAVALFEIGRLQEAQGVLIEAVGLADSMGDRQTALRASIQRDQVGLYLDPSGADIPSLVTNARLAVRGLGHLGDRLGSARAWRQLSELLLMTGHAVDAAHASRRSIDDATAAGSRRERALALGQLAVCWIWGPTPAERCRRELRQILDASRDDPLVEANLLAFLAVADAMAAAESDAFGHMEAARAMTRDLGLAWQVAYHDTLAAETRRLLGAPGEAGVLFRSALATFLDQGDRWMASITYLDLASILIELGQVEDAAQALERADDLGFGPDVDGRIKRAAYGARVLAHLGQADAALSQARVAVQLAEATDYAEHQARALQVLAEVEAVVGHLDEARATAAKAVHAYMRKGDRASASQVRALIGATQDGVPPKPRPRPAPGNRRGAGKA